MASNARFCIKCVDAASAYNARSECKCTSGEATCGNRHYRPVCLSYLRDCCKFNSDACKNDHEWYECKHSQLNSNASIFTPKQEAVEGPVDHFAEGDEFIDALDVYGAREELYISQQETMALFELLKSMGVSKQKITGAIELARTKALAEIDAERHANLAVVDVQPE